MSERLTSRSSDDVGDLTLVPFSLIDEFGDKRYQVLPVHNTAGKVIDQWREFVSPTLSASLQKTLEAMVSEQNA